MNSSQSARTPVLRLTVTGGPHASQSVTWSKLGRYLIGRGAHTQLALSHDLTASVEHCCIEITEHSCLIEDLGSRQGTLVNGRPASRNLLQSGDIIQVGMSTLETRVQSPLDREATQLQRSSWLSTARMPGTSSDPSSATGALEIPGYEITRKLGEGGMGVVYDAFDQRQRQRVAIKTIIPGRGAQDKSILLFQREMELLSQLSHPRIVRHIASGAHAGQIYLVMEYVDAVDVQAIVNELSRSRQIAVYCHVVCDVLEALEFAHQKRLVHRDVKPRNILVSRQAGRLHVKLADFGLAKNFELAGLSYLTEDGEIRGTPAFMPWEQLRNSRYAKPSADIYAVAATLGCYLTGKSPGHSVPGTSIFSLTDVPQELAAVLDQALAASPGDRPATAAQLRRSLLPFTDQRFILRLPTTAP